MGLLLDVLKYYLNGSKKCIWWNTIFGKPKVSSFLPLRKKVIGILQHVGSFANSFWILWNRTSLWIWMFLLTLFAFCKQPFSWLLEKVNMEDCQKSNCSSPGEGWLLIQSQAEYLSTSLLMHLLRISWEGGLSQHRRLCSLWESSLH